MSLLPRGSRLLALLFTLILALDGMPPLGFADGPTSGLAPFPAAVLRRLEQEAPQYLELKALFDKQRRQEENLAVPSARSRRLQALLTRLRAEASSTTTIDPEDPEGAHIANYTRWDGQISRFTSIVPSAVESNEAVRNDVAGMIARFIVERAADDGLIPFDPPPPLRESAAREMNLGYAAAKQKDYAGAILHFEKARAITPNAPEICYNLGLAESKIPGRELRAVVWFGAYLASDPGAPNAPGIRKQIADLEAKGVTRFIKLTEEIANEIPDPGLRQSYLVDLAGLWASINKRDEQPAPTRAPFVAPRDWVGKNEALLNNQMFLDLNGYLKTLQGDSPGKIFEALKESARKMVAAHDEIWAMLDELERINPRGPASGSDSAEGGGTVAATPDPAVSGGGPNKAEEREYSYQGRQVTLHPDQVFDITGKVEKTEITVADFGAGSEYGLTLVLNEHAKQAFNDFTVRNLGKETGLIYQTRLVMVAVMQSPISAGVVSISGGYRTAEEAQKAAAEFKAE